jgi:hypothetical protein
MGAIQSIIVIAYDCDHTLIPEYMQNGLLRKNGIEPENFWKESNQLKKDQKELGINLDFENAYLNLLLQYSHSGKLEEISNKKLREEGKNLQTFQGLPDFFERIKTNIENKPECKEHGIKIEQYIISTGLKEMILGSSLYNPKYIEDVFASEFLEVNGKISQIARAVGHMKKTEFLYLLNKGGNKNPSIDINGRMPNEARRIPFENMIYVGDGPTDVPCFATLSDEGGKSVAVYNPDSDSAFKKAILLQKQRRVFTFGPADYRENTDISRKLFYLVNERAQEIIKNRQDDLMSKISDAPSF